MNKISYPTDPVVLVDFENQFYASLTKNKIDKINNHLKKIIFKGVPLNFEKLVTLKFEELLELRISIISYRDSISKTIRIINGKLVLFHPFEDLFDYNGNQPKIASFFMNQKTLYLKSCHYCSIDYINAFKDLSDYESPLRFINEASLHELQIIKNINESLAQKIINKRTKAKYNYINELPVKSSIKKEIEKFDFKNTHNHFTLDHFFPQNSHKFYSLCLYNLVPSCYSCNSKFKKEIEFDINDKLKYISPTSQVYSFLNDFHFKLFFSKKIDEIKSEKDFVLEKEITYNEEHIQTYLRMFKIPGRYTYHKDIIIRLIDKKVKYSDSKLIELSKGTGLPIIEVKKMIFGEELFDDKFSNQPLYKFRQDIADNIGIFKDVEIIS